MNKKNLSINSEKTIAYINNAWETHALPTLKSFMTIPNKSPDFDPDWQKNGYMDKATELLAQWARERKIKDLGVQILREPGLTPLIYIEVPGDSDKTVLLYGHLDKQPEMTGWHEDLGPWKAVQKGEKLYGRGGADDGYAIFAALLAIEALQEQGVPHCRCVLLIEASEESGSIHLPQYMQKLEKRIGTPSLVIGLDSGCGNYEQLWTTTSLRGLVGGTLKIRVLEEGVHSGYGSGIVPSSFRILRMLLDRIENSVTGDILLEEFHVDIPAKRIEQAKLAATVLDGEVFDALPRVENLEPVNDNMANLLLNRTWKPTLCVTGADGLPAISNAGNVLRPYTTVKLSLRIPPTCNPQKASQKLKDILEADSPYNAKVTYHPEQESSGWHAPILAEWLEKACQEASNTYFGKEALCIGEGGTIPFMGMLGKQFPQAQFLITGVLGPKSNAHGPNEFLHITMAKKLTACVSHVLASHYSS